MRRLERGRERGVSRASARGHKATPEHPQRAQRAPWKYPEYFQSTRYGRERLQGLSPDKLAEMNLLRALEGKHELAVDDPGAGAGRRQMFGSFEEAERWAAAIPWGYVTLYPEREAWGVRIQRAA